MSTNRQDNHTDRGSDSDKVGMVDVRSNFVYFDVRICGSYDKGNPDWMLQISKVIYL